jgi:hypothetical protein
MSIIFKGISMTFKSHQKTTKKWKCGEIVEGIGITAITGGFLAAALDGSIQEVMKLGLINIALGAHLGLGLLDGVE